jgi:hypothetical protein
VLSDIADCDISDIYDISDCVCDKALSGGKWKREHAGCPPKSTLYRNYPIVII